MNETNRPARLDPDRDVFEHVVRRRRDERADDSVTVDDSVTADDTQSSTAGDTATAAGPATDVQRPAVAIADDHLLDDPVMGTGAGTPRGGAPDGGDAPDVPTTAESTDGDGWGDGTSERPDLSDHPDWHPLWEVFEAGEDLLEFGEKLLEEAGDQLGAAAGKIGEVVESGMGTVWDGGESDGDDGDSDDDDGDSDDGGDTISGGDLEGGDNMSGQFQSAPTDSPDIGQIVALDDTTFGGAQPIDEVAADLGPDPAFPDIEDGG